MKLALKLLYEWKVKGPDSRLRNYVEDLQAIEIETPVAWEESEIRELHYPFLEARILEQKKQWNTLYREFVSAASSSKVTEADFLWALQAVRSRTFSGPYAGMSHS